MEVAALVLPRSLPGGPELRRLPERRTLLDPGDARAAAAAAGIPCWEVARPTGGPLPRELPRADRLCTACFPWRLPRTWIADGLNIHPSLLPTFRGPAPLFWQLREEAAPGVTVHRLEERVDAGAVIAQERVSLPDGIRTDPAEALLARAGARLLARALRDGVAAGAPQDESRASRQGWPDPDHRVVPSSWTARRAFNFVRGGERWGPFAVEAGGRTIALGDAIGYQAERPADQPGEAAIALADGWLRVAPG